MSFGRRLVALSKAGAQRLPGVSHSQQSPHCSPVAGNVTAAIPKQPLCALVKRATHSQPATSFRHSLVAPRTKVGTSQPRASERAGPEGMLHGSSQKGNTRRQREDGSRWRKKVGERAGCLCESLGPGRARAAGSPFCLLRECCAPGPITSSLWK